MVDGIGSSLPPSNYNNAGDPNPYAHNNPQFVQLIDASWEAILACQNDPSDLNVQTLQQSVNNLVGYFNQNGVPGMGTDAFQMYNEINQDIVVSSGGHTYTLKELCSDSKGMSIIQDFLKGTNSSGMNPGNNSTAILKSLYKTLYEYSNYFADNKNTTIQTDLDSLDSDLSEYSSNPSYYAPRIAGDIAKFLSDSKSVSDGYLTNLVAMLNAGGSNSLATLAANYTTSPTSANLTAFETALGGLQQSSEGSDLLWMVKFSISEEYGSGQHPNYDPSNSYTNNEGAYAHTNPQFVQLIDASWEAVTACKNDPSDLNVQTLQQSLNNLISYFNQNGVPGTGTDALQMYDEINQDIVVSSGGHAYTLKELCSNSNGMSIIEDFLKGTNNSGMNPGNNSTDILKSLYNTLYEYSSYFADNQIAIFETDLNTLNSDLSQYNSNPSYYAPRIAGDITKFLSDAKGDPTATPPVPAVSDGYLTNLVAMLNAGGSNSLAALAANYSTNPTAFETALGGLATGSQGSDLLWMVKFSIRYEY